MTIPQTTQQAKRAPQLLYVELANLIRARLNCQQRTPEPNQEWFERHTDTIKQLVKDYMPSGGGIDDGTRIDLDRSTGSKLVFTTNFHHMDESGMYDGWTEHTVTVRPSFGGIELTISGRNRNDIKDYLHETFEYALSQLIER